MHRAEEAQILQGLGVSHKVEELNGDGMVCHFHKYSMILFENKIKRKNKKRKE